MADYFAVPVFFICFRECLETSIIVAVLQAWLKKTVSPDQDPVVYKRLLRQIWFGIVLGIVVCIIIGCGMIGAFYGIQQNFWSSTEEIWEGTFALVAAFIITIMGGALLRINKLQDKWRVKMAKALDAKAQTPSTAGGRFKLWCEKYAMFILPLVTVLREGLEAVVFIGGVGLTLPPTAFPLAVLCGLGLGALLGYIIYRAGTTKWIQVFMIASTCFLYLIAAGLFSKAIWFFQQKAWNNATGGDASETGSGPGSYDIRQSVWHVNCCNPEIDGGGGWGVFNSLFGWQNSATIGSVLGYNLYWIAVICGFSSMLYYEKRGHWPFMKAKAANLNASDASDTESITGGPQSSNAAAHV